MAPFESVRVPASTGRRGRSPALAERLEEVRAGLVQRVGGVALVGPLSAAEVAGAGSEPAAIMRSIHGSASTADRSAGVSGAKAMTSPSSAITATRGAASSRTAAWQRSLASNSSKLGGSPWNESS